jgi:uncharacterized protein
MLVRNTMYNLISANDYQEIEKALTAHADIANQGITCDNSPFSPKGHPLHRICDAVFAGSITDDEAIQLAKLFLNFGANINGFKANGDNNTPLIAAASLHAEKLGIFYIDEGADIFYQDKNDGATALHWAAFCGMDHLVGQLIDMGARVNQTDNSFNSTPAGWAVHALMSKDAGNLHHQSACIKLMLRAGSDQSLLSKDALAFLQASAKNDPELKGLIGQ